MCSNIEEQPYPQEEEEEEDDSSTSPYSYPTYYPRFTFNKNQKSRLGKLRSSRVEAHTSVQPISKDGEDFSKSTDYSQKTVPFTSNTPYVKGTGLSWMRETPGKSCVPFNFGSEGSSETLKTTENSLKTSINIGKQPTNIIVNDSEMSYPSNIFSNDKKDKISIFNPTVCKGNIQFNTPCKGIEDKENFSHISDGKNYQNQQNSIKITHQPTRKGLFGFKTLNNNKNVNNVFKPIEMSDSLEMDKINQQIETNPTRITQKSNQQENIFPNSNVTNSTKNQEKEAEVNSQPLEHPQKISMLDPKPNLFESKVFNFNLEGFNKPVHSIDSNEMEIKSQINKNQRVTLFDFKPRISDSLAFSGAKQHSNSDLNKETYEVSKYIPTAHKTIFDRHFLFTAGSKTDTDKENLSDESLTPLDLSSGEYLNKTSFNCSEQSSHSSESIIDVENSVKNVKKAEGPPDHEVGNESGINILEQESSNTKDQMVKADSEINLLPTRLVLACPKSKVTDAFDSKSSENMNIKPIFSEHNNVPQVKNVDQIISVVPEQLLNTGNEQIQDGTFQKPTSSNRPYFGTETQRAGSHQINHLEHLPSEVSQLKTSGFNLVTNQQEVNVNHQQINISKTHQPVINQANYHTVAKPEEDNIIPSMQSLNFKMSKFEPPEQAVIPQTQSLHHSNLGAMCHNVGIAKSEAQSILPRVQSFGNNQKVLPTVLNLNKHTFSSKTDPNQIQSVLSIPHSITTDHKQNGLQLLSSTSFHADKFSSKEKSSMFSNGRENHQNMFVQPSNITLSSNQTPFSHQNIISQPESVIPKKQYNSNLHQIVPCPPQQAVSQQQSLVGHSHNNLPTTNNEHQPGTQNYQSANHSYHPINPAQSYTNNAFIKPSNPAPRFGDRFSTLKKKTNFNVHTNYGMSTGDRENKCLYVKEKGYTILSMLGKGGSSVVYQVIDPTTSNLMAVKCVDLRMVDNAIAEGYLNEIKLLSKLQGCSTVIKMFDHEHVKEDKMLYVVMEKGDTDFSRLIRDICKTTKISLSMIIYYWTEMLTVVRDIHERGIIHSDLKPANFLLVSGRLKLIDFGIASSLQGDMTSVQKDVTTGTWNYMSPEALRPGKGSKISYKSDVWSLGCILYNLVYGKTPFSHITHALTKMQAIIDDNHRIDFPPTNIPPVLSRALKSCLHRDLKQRPTVTELLDMPYHATVDQISLGQEVKNILPAESWAKIQHLFVESKQENKKELEYAG